MIYPGIEQMLWHCNFLIFFLGIDITRKPYLKSWPHDRESSVGSKRNIVKKTMRLICGKQRLVLSE
jgi:hypothetical protein